MLEVLRTQALRAPDRNAIVQDGRAISYAVFYRRIAAFRRHFAGMNPAPGRNALLLIHHLADHWCAALALRSLGLNIVPVISLAQADSLGLRDMALLVISAAEQHQHDLRSSTLGGVPFVALGLDALAGLDAIPLDQPSPPAPPFGGQLLLSSGTTGTSKKLFIPGALQAAHSQEQAGKWGFDAATIFHGIAFPSATMIGFHAPPAVWRAGGCVVFDQKPDQASRFFDHAPTSAFVLPPMLRELHARWAESGRGPMDCDLRPGGGFVTQDMLQMGLAFLSRPMLVVYGSTELTTFSLSQRLEQPEDLLWLTPAERPVQVVDDAGQELPAGEQGELRILRHATDCSGYLDDPATSAQHFRDGWFHPGDLAVRRADGRVRILGRASDVVVVAGRKLPTAPLEQDLQRQLAVQEVCLFTRLSEAGVEELVVAIQAPFPLTQAAQDQARASFTPYFQRVHCVVLPSFPRTATAMAKVRRAELRQQVFALVDQGEAQG